MKATRTLAVCLLASLVLSSVVAQTRLYERTEMVPPRVAPVSQEERVKNLVKQGMTKDEAEKLVATLIQLDAKGSITKSWVGARRDGDRVAVAIMDLVSGETRLASAYVIDERTQSVLWFVFEGERTSAQVRPLATSPGLGEIVGSPLALPLLLGDTPHRLKFVKDRDGKPFLPASNTSDDGYRFEGIETANWKAISTGEASRIERNGDDFLVRGLGITRAFIRANKPVPDRMEKVLDQLISQGGVPGATVFDYRLGVGEERRYEFTKPLTLGEAKAMPRME